VWDSLEADFRRRSPPGDPAPGSYDEDLVPPVWASPEPADTLRAYASLNLDEEVRTEGWVRNVGDFPRFLEAMSFSHRGVLNVSNLARECQVRRTTVEDFLGVLEGLVARHLRAWIAYSRGDFELSFWRTRGGSEVDFVVYGSDGFWAMEVKNTRQVRPEHLRSVRAFVDEYPSTKVALLYRGAERLRVGDVPCLPVEEFLEDLTPRREIFYTPSPAESQNDPEIPQKRRDVREVQVGLTGVAPLAVVQDAHAGTAGISSRFQIVPGVPHGQAAIRCDTQPFEGLQERCT
jgi:hypothetical protein